MIYLEMIAATVGVVVMIIALQNEWGKPAPAAATPITIGRGWLILWSLVLVGFAATLIRLARLL